MYREVQGIPPDLTVLFDELGWRSVGSVGSGDIYTFENDTGPDDANHALDGIAIAHLPDGRKLPLDGAVLYDVGPTILRLMGMEPPGDMIGNAWA